MDSVPGKISKLYEDASFMSLYAGDLVITVFIILIVFVVASYFNIMTKIKPIQDDWPNQRCNPSVMPFAGLINAPDGQSSLEYTSANFNNCTQTILEELADYALAPLYYVMNVMTELFQELQEAMNSMREMFNRMREATQGISVQLYHRSLNIMLPLVPLFRSMLAMFGKAQGTMTASLYTLYGGYVTLNSTFMFIYELVVEILIAIVVAILACFAIGWFFPPALVAGFSMAAFMTILLIPTIIVLVLMQEIFSVSGKSPPGVPSYCFAGDTLINIKDGSPLPIRDVQPGMTLEDGSRVTGVMKSTSEGCELYTLNGVVVTGTHMVFDTKHGWLHSRNHPKSTVVEDFRDTHVWCLGTDSKTIRINGTIFADWDEIDELDMEELRSASPRNSAIPLNINKNDIHPYLDTGLHGDTLVCLDDGRSIMLSEVEVGDVLMCGEVVNSVVMIECSDIIRFEKIMHDGEVLFTATSNVEVDNDSLGVDLNIVRETTCAPDVAYHLVTDRGYFKIAGVKVGDYNRGLERYLSDENLRDSATKP